MTQDPRLPTTVRPEKYTLWLRPNFQAFTFEGTAETRIRILEATNRIVVNASELKIHEARVTLPAGVVVEARDIQLDPKAERATFVFDRALLPGPATLFARFTGILNDRLAGFYRSRYETPGGEARYMAASQFEATDARQAFPCWDEPAFKASFEVTLEIPKEFVAVSNTPAAEVKDLGDGTRRVRFAETPRMSSYLLALIVGPLEAMEAKSARGTRIRVWALPDKIRHGGWALENAVRILDYLDDYYGIPYPLEKLDHIALSDFAAGAMENWGAITYRERILLHDPATSSALTRQQIVDVMAHETAHMWFGDLVTMAWYDDLWLNESFATWMGTKAVDALYPDWEMWTQFLHHDAIRGLTLDGLKTSHPIQVEVGDPAEIREIFDEISYSKGASLLWMLERFLGEDVFRRGLRDYLERSSYANARTEDLWAALEKASGQPVRALMSTWTRQTGFPLLEADVERTRADARLVLRQSRFLYEHILGAADEGVLWKVPVHILRAGAAEPTTLFMEEAEIAHDLGKGLRAGPDDWIKVNAGQVGFYRVNYPPAEWERLGRAVERGELSARDRLGLQSDAYALMRAGYLPATTFLRLAASYRNDSDASVWLGLSESLQGLEALVADRPYFDRFQAYAKDLFRPVADRMGWQPRPGEGHLDAILRATVLTRVGHYGDGGALREASERFRRYLKDATSLPPDLRDPVFALAAQEADDETYETFWDLERKATLSEEKVRLLQALTRTRRRNLLQETLERSLNEKQVRPQDAVPVITGVAANRPSVGRDLAWDFIQNRWTELYRRYAGTGFLLQRLVQVSGAFASREKAREVEAFFASHPAPEAHRAVNQSLERIRTNAAWIETNSQELARWFR